MCFHYACADISMPLEANFARLMSFRMWTNLRYLNSCGKFALVVRSSAHSSLLSATTTNRLSKETHQLEARMSLHEM